MGAPRYPKVFRISYWPCVVCRVSNLPGPHVFSSERGGPIAPKSFHTLRELAEETLVEWLWGSGPQRLHAP
jgi:hypothetical protein